MRYLAIKALTRLFSTEIKKGYLCPRQDTDDNATEKAREWLKVQYAAYMSELFKCFTENCSASVQAELYLAVKDLSQVV